MAIVLGLALWKSRRPALLAPRPSAQRSVRTCHGLLCAAGACDFFYFLGVLIHQPFLPGDMFDSALLCQIQGAVIDVFLLASACCLSALAHEIWFIHNKLLNTLQRGLPSPEEEWNARKKRSIGYAIFVVLVPTIAVTINGTTAGYGAVGPARNEAWCWLKHPPHSRLLKHPLHARVCASPEVVLPFWGGACLTGPAGAARGTKGQRVLIERTRNQVTAGT